jgi:hypothetical protein
MLTQTSVVSGLSHLNGLNVMAHVDGGTQGPFLVAGGSITLTTPGYDILVGLQYIPQLQQLPPEDPPGTLKGKRSREVSVRMRVMNTGPGLKIGDSFTTLNPFRPLISSTDPGWNVPYLPNGLGTGEIGLNLPPLGTHRAEFASRWMTPNHSQSSQSQRKLREYDHED